MPLLLNQKFLQKYNVKQKRFGTKNVGREAAQKSLSDFCELGGVPNDGVNNMWARKTFIRASVIIDFKNIVGNVDYLSSLF